MSRPSRDYFDKARAVAALLLILAAAGATVGSLLDWVTITRPERVPADQAHRLEPFAGVETTDGWIVIAGATIVLLSAALLLVRKRSLYGWVAFWASVVIGGIAIADYRGIDELSFVEMQRIGEPAPAVGITLVAISAFIGIVGAVAGVAASPRPE